MNRMNRRCDVSHYLFFFNDTATTEIYTLSLHDALPISMGSMLRSTKRTYSPGSTWITEGSKREWCMVTTTVDRKSTRLNSSHANISYAVFCLKKKYKHG